MSWEDRGELRADPGAAPGDRGVEIRQRRSIWPSIAVVAAAAAFGGVIWFAYQNGRDVHSGPPPLVKADPNPAKVKPRPDQQGGQEIPFQDSTVYDRLNQNGPKPVVEKLLPPPESPVARPPAPAPQAMNATIDPSLPPVSLPTALPPPGQDITSPTALAPAPGAMITQPPAAPRQPPMVTAPTVAAPKIAQTPPSKTTSAPAGIAALESRALAEMPAKPAAGGAYRIQISAVRTPDAVAPEWARLKHRFPETLNALTLSSSKINVADKGVFYRVEAGPLDAAAAKSACDHLRAQGLGCVVAKP
jgi:hypothetical protein